MTELPSAEMKIGMYEHLCLEVLQRYVLFRLSWIISGKLSVSAILSAWLPLPTIHFIARSSFSNFATI